MNYVQFWKQIVITHICSGSVSLIASSVIVTFVALNGLSNPYRRIIFALSVSDVLQSFGYVAGPFFTPSEDVPQALWGIGNKHTCHFTGFLFMMGSAAVPMYTMCLSIYYLCKVRGKMSDAQFAHKVERKMHIITILTSLSLPLTALLMDAINTSNVGNMCLASARPAGCRQNPEIYGECDPAMEKSTIFFNFVTITLIPVLCLMGIITCLTMIFWNVVITERISGLPRSADQVVQSDQNGETEETEQPSTGSADARDDLRAVARRYKRELVAQACCYILVFLLSAMPWLLTSLTLLAGSQPSQNLYRAAAFFAPLGGFFNIIVYCRLNVESFHRRHPECPRIQAFWMVLKAGGEIPSDRDWDESMAWRPCCCFQHHKSIHEMEPQENEGLTHRDPESLDKIQFIPNNDSNEIPSLFPIAHANIGRQETISDLHIRMASAPVISESIPNSAEGMKGGSSELVSKDLKGFSDVQAFESKHLKGFSNAQSLESSDCGIDEEMPGISMNDLRGFSDIHSSEVDDKRQITQDYEDVGSLSTRPMRNPAYRSSRDQNILSIHSSAPQQQDNVGDYDDIWADAFKKVREWRPSE